MIKRQLQELRISPSSPVDPIERIKQKELKKIVDPIIAKAKDAFAECVIELKEVLELRKNKLEKEEKKENEKQEIIALEVITS